MRSLLTLLLLLLLPVTTLMAQVEEMERMAHQHLRLQTQGLPGKVSIRLTPPDISRLPPCQAMEAFTPSGATLSGKTHVGIRCLTPSSWSILIQAQISVEGSYVRTARPLLAGHQIQAADLTLIQGDIASLPTGALTNREDIIGKTLKNSLGAGQTIRSDQLQSPILVRQGEVVRIWSRGPGFAVSTEGKALHNASAGQILQLRTPSGQTLSGKVNSIGEVEISN